MQDLSVLEIYVTWGDGSRGACSRQFPADEFGQARAYAQDFFDAETPLAVEVKENVYRGQRRVASTSRLLISRRRPHV